MPVWHKYFEYFWIWLSLEYYDLSLKTMSLKYADEEKNEEKKPRKWN